MGELSKPERATIDRAGAEPMLDQLLAWAAVNSGSRNLAGLETWRACSPSLRRASRRAALEPPAPVEAVDQAGRTVHVQHGRHFHLSVRPDGAAAIAVHRPYGHRVRADHAFQETRWLEDGVLDGPGVADMKGGIAVMLAALKAVGASPRADRFGYEVVINSDEEVGSLSSARCSRGPPRASARR